MHVQLAPFLFADIASLDRGSIFHINALCALYYSSFPSFFPLCISKSNKISSKS